MCELSKRGVMSVMISSAPFIKLGRAQAAVFGVPGLPIIEIPHPLGGLQLASVKERALLAATQLNSILREQSR